MADFTMEEMLQMQRALQEKYKHKWEPICPETGKNKMLWMLAELGEAIQIIKRHSSTELMQNGGIRYDFVEELADVLMYFNDIMLCYDISQDEFERVYRAKHESNLSRWKKPE